ncbi:MAG TPA: hypothetical protein VNU19_12675 [Candidatus Acidoferrum sp.]|jgi:hypothetical protein|nr:hypothetical protein [Candidatus Acidoferrum sp.]
MTRPDDSRTRVGDVRAPWLLPLLAFLCVAAFVYVLHLTSYRTFFLDEWTFIVSRRPWDIGLILLPQNGYLTVIPIMVWKLLFATVGLRSYVPYEAALLATHVAVVLLLFVLIRRRSGDLPALAASATLLFLGSGAENIVYAFQINWVGAAAFGLLAMLLLDGQPPFPGRLPAVSLALLCSVMCHTIGIAFVAAVFIELAADPTRRRFLLSLVVPVAALGAWLLVFSTGHGSATPGVFSGVLRGGDGPTYFLTLARFVLSGVETSAAGIAGLPVTAGPAALAVLAGFAGWNLYRQGRIQTWQLGMVGGVLSLFGLAALGRAEGGPLYATQSRYIYEGAVFLLPLAAHAAAELPWRGLWRPALAASFALALLSNMIQLQIRAVSQIDFMRIEVAELQTVDVFRGAPDMTAHGYIDNAAMAELQASDYLAATAELGSPVPRISLDALRQLPPDAVDRVMLNLFGGAVTITADSARSVQGLICRDIESTAGFSINLNVPNGQAVMLQSSAGGEAMVYLGFESPPSPQPVYEGQLSPTTQEWVQLPDTGKPITWQLRITTSDVGLIRICRSAGALLS